MHLEADQGPDVELRLAVIAEIFRSDERGGGDGGACTLPKSTGIHCGGIATGWLTSASMSATLGSALCGRYVAQKAVAAPMRTNAWKLEAARFA
jgi:hypothetical protein